MHSAQRLVNHVAFVLDESSSMAGHAAKLIEVADEQIRHLALRSEELNQETRVSVYTFADTVTPQIFDMDVMRLPSIADLYRPHGLTALIDAVIKSQEDLSTTSTLYGDHGFLTFALTDGMENRSRRGTSDLARTLTNHSDRGIAFLVPDRQGVAYLERIGVSGSNVQTWDTRSSAGLVDAVQTIRTATENFMTSRATGTYNASRGVFSTGADAVNDATVKSNLTPLDPRNYRLMNVSTKSRIDDFVNDAGIHYQIGRGYYQLSKTETIQPQKEIIVVDKNSGQAYSGAQARQLIGLPNYEVRVRPDANPKYNIFVQSTSVNRNLMPGTKLLVRV